jgi:hypothetical protein
MTQRIQIHRRRFAYKVGNTFVGVWELTPISPILRLRHYQKLSFVVPRPDAIDRAWLRSQIFQRINGGG